jgi:ATP-dependent RNA helicase RhlE
MSFADLNLIPELLRAVADEGYQEPTPIQAKAIPAVLARRDLMGCAQTGTGKTAGFTLPVLQLLAPQANTSLSPARHPVRALILVPTRELAAQVQDSVKAYGRHLPLRSTVVYGGVDMTPQTKALHAGVEILVATPGRLLDHMQQKTVNLSRVEILVLDEADRMLDMGFIPDIKRILAVLPAQRQSLLFSATFSEEIKRLANQMLHAPLLIEVARRNAPADLVTHQVYEVPALRKRALLAHLIRSREMKQVLVFVRMKRDANRLARELARDGIVATAIHSDRSQAEREQALQEFKDGKATVLVATDIAARGLDIEQLPFVVNYELPYSPEDYVHRIGRTGRAGMPGVAISLMCADETRMLADIEKLLKRTLPREAAEQYRSGESTERRRPSDDERPRRRDEGGRPRRRDDEMHGGRREHRATRSAARESTVDASGFDFSKPYEPATDTASKPAPERMTSLRGHRKPIAALLGGLPKDKK